MKRLFEAPYWQEVQLGGGRNFLAASDEVGRGPLAGPVIAATVVLPCLEQVDPQLFTNFFCRLGRLGVTDSKSLAPLKRKKILQTLQLSVESLEENRAYVVESEKTLPLWVALAAVEAPGIDQMNILRASLLAMKNSLSSCLEVLAPVNKGIWLIDGNQKVGKFWEMDYQCTEVPVVKGDSRSKLIALASIVAKEYRDRLMKKYAEDFPQYGLAQNAGYPTKAHRLALKKFGPTLIHRKTFAGVKELC